MVSKKLKVAIFLDEKRAYQIAQEVGMHPSTLSRLINGIERVKPNDPRILKIAEIVGVPTDECFERI